MNILEKKMVESLKDLKQNHHVIGVKAEFEAEGARIEEVIRLKEVVTLAGLDLTIKIGGCEALKDMYDARIIGVKAIVAPMVESAYAMKKYIQATKLAFPQEEKEEIDFLINVETITGFKNVDEMLELPEAKDLAGIVLGRADMVGSMGLTRDEVNSDEIFNMANSLLIKAFQHNKKLGIGGSVSAQSLPFFRQLSKNSLAGAFNFFETRKVIFDAQKALADENAEAGISKALEFELMWLKNKRDFYGMIYNEDKQRIVMLESQQGSLMSPGAC